VQVSIERRRIAVLARLQQREPHSGRVSDSWSFTAQMPFLTSPLLLGGGAAGMGHEC
jgi:hypothetical protein